MKNIFQVLSFVTVLLFFGSCKPSEADAVELGAVPTGVSFTVAEKPGEVNTYILTNNTASGPFLYQWDFGDGTIGEGDVVEIYYQDKGDYEVTLRAFNQGGFGEEVQTISVAEDDATPCATGSIQEFLSGCDQLTWVLAPVDGAYWVGPDDATTWWANSADDVTTRYCAFDDEWTFKVTGEMVYDTKGELWAEDFMGFNFECVTDDLLAPVVAPWASGTHGFETIEGAIKQLRVIGIGAFMGLPKASNGAEILTPSASQVTYDIIEMETTATGKSMTIEVNMGAGLWRFKYVTL